MEKGGLLKRNGFSLFEILVILLVLSILTGMVVTRSRKDDFNLATEAEILKAHIRYVRHLALVNDVHSWEIRFEPDRYTLYRNGSAAGLSLPNEDSATHLLKAGVEVSLSAFETGVGVGNLRWDKWGRPVNAADLRLTMTDTLQGQSLDFRILQETGIIQ